MAMTEMDPRDAAIEGRLRRAMTAPIPTLSPEFHANLSSKLRRRSEGPEPFGRILLVVYAGVSAVVSTLVMRGQGLGWAVIGVMAMGALATFELARRLQRRETRSAAA
jgi:hypothetical protein